MDKSVSSIAHLIDEETKAALVAVRALADRFTEQRALHGDCGEGCPFADQGVIDNMELLRDTVHQLVLVKEHHDRKQRVKLSNIVNFDADYKH